MERRECLAAAAACFGSVLVLIIGVASDPVFANSGPETSNSDTDIRGVLDLESSSSSGSLAIENGRFPFRELVLTRPRTALLLAKMFVLFVGEEGALLLSLASQSNTFPPPLESSSRL